MKKSGSFGGVLLLGLIVLLASCSTEARNARITKRADKYFESGQYDKAKIEYLNLLRADSQNATAIRQLGIIWFEQGAPLRAVPYLLKSREVAPGSLNARTKLIEALIALGEMTEARKEALEILRRDSVNEIAIVALADSVQNKEDIVSTKDQLQQFKSSSPLAFYLASASLSARNGNFVSAENDVRRALELDPKSAMAHSARANLLLAQKKMAGAEEELRIAADLSPIRSAERLRYAEFKSQQGAMEEARTLLHKITHSAPDYIPAWILLARTSLRENKHDEALTHLENVFSCDPTNYNGQLLQAQARLARGETDTALEGLKHLDEMYPNVPLTKLNLARAYLMCATPEQAIAALKETLEINPDYIEASLLLAEVNLRNGKPGQVTNAMKEVLEKRPNLRPAQLLLADAYRAMGNFSDAATILRGQVTTEPDSFQAHFLLGLVLRQQQKPAEARKSFERAAALAPGNFLTLYQLTELDIEKNDFAAAHTKAQRSIENNPDSARAQFVEGKIYAAQNEWELAAEALLKAIELDVDFTSAYELLVGIYVANGKLDEAVRQLEVFLEKKPDDVRVLLTSAIVYERMNQYAKARDSYEKVIAANPRSVDALNNLAWLYVDHFNKLDKAYEIAVKARALRPDDGAIADTLGWIVCKQGDYQTALRLLQESAAKLPDQPEIQFHLGMASYLMGLEEKARAAFGRAAGSSLEFPGKEEARRRLAMLENTRVGFAELTSSDAEKYLADRPDDPLGLMRLGEAYEHEGDFVKAAETYEHLLDLNPKLLQPTKKIAQLYAGPLQNIDKAFEFAKKARKLAPADPQVFAMLGQIAYQNGNFEWAYSLLLESKRQLADNPEILHNLAWAAYSLGRVSEARDAMQRVVKLSADSHRAKDAEAFLAMTALVQTEADLAGAGAEIEKLCTAKPDYVPAMMARARLMEQRNDREAAVATYEFILKRFPDFVPAQKHLAGLYLKDPMNRTKSYDLALKARKTLPDDPKLAEILGRLTYQRKDFAYALQLFEESARGGSLGAESLYYLGMAQFYLNQKKKAQAVLEKSLAAGLDKTLAAEAERTIAELTRDAVARP